MCVFIACLRRYLLSAEYQYIYSWQQDLEPKTTRHKAPTKMPNEALLKDVEQYPDDCMYERENHLGCG